MSFEALLNKTVNVESRTQGQDAFGEITNTWSTKHASMPCRIQPNRNVDERVNRGGEYMVVPFIIYAAVDYDIADDDRIVDGTTVYEVVRALKDSSEHHWELKCKIVDN